MKFSSLLLTLILTFYLGIHNRQLALIRSADHIPVKNYGLEVNMLPPADQRALKVGIPIRSSLHLAQILEDYLA